MTRQSNAATAIASLVTEREWQGQVTQAAEMPRPQVNGPWDTAAGFLNERQDILYVFVVKSPGSGWDVVLRVDGSYSDRHDAERGAAGIVEWIEGIRDIRSDKRKWWHGPPWLRGRIR